MFCAFLTVAAASSHMAAQQQQLMSLPDFQKVKDNYYVLGASSLIDRSKFTGANVGLFITDAGVTLVDTKVPGYGSELLARIRKVTQKPVTMVINTHHHFDHTGTNEAFVENVTFVAHENAKVNMLKMDSFKADKARFAAGRTFTDKMSIGKGKDQIDLYYFGRGHTNGDAWIVFPALRLLMSGDMFAWKDAPGLDRANGGSMLEFPKTLARGIAAIKNIDTVVPGHSDVTTPADLQQYWQYTSELVSLVEAAKKAGKTVDQTVEGLAPLTARYSGYRSDRLKPVVDAIYAELDGR